MGLVYKQTTVREDTTILDHPIFLTSFDQKTIRSKMDIRTKENDPSREVNDSTVLHFFVQWFHGFGDILNNF